MKIEDAKVGMYITDAHVDAQTPWVWRIEDVFDTGILVKHVGRTEHHKPNTEPYARSARWLDNKQPLTELEVADAMLIGWNQWCTDHIRDSN
jgi:hypothetical protein